MASKLFDLSRITNYKKKRKPKNKKVNSRLQEYADKLEAALPTSERWFRDLWSKDMVQDRLSLYQDAYNSPLGKYIPDVLNRGYKYIIEIDGSVHNTELQQWKDRLKDAYYRKKGYIVYRIPAYDMEKYISVRDAIRKHISITERRY